MEMYEWEEKVVADMVETGRQHLRQEYKEYQRKWLAVTVSSRRW